MTRALLAGIVLWIAGTIGIRFSGHGLLRPEHTGQTLLLYAGTFVIMAVLIPRLCRRFGFEKESRFRAATLLMLPTLILDPFSSLYFAQIFPNLDPANAGAFGGWMLICCAGAIVGVWIWP
jgi:Na+/melibiose symporter-like transporter